MKKLVHILFYGIAFMSLSAKDVDVSYAMQVAKNFYLQNNTENLNYSLTLAEAVSMPANVGTSIDGKPVYYVFNVSGNHGFVIVSGDDLVEPVLGYSHQGNFKATELNPAAAKWMENYKQQIIYVKQNVHETTPVISQKWVKYYNNVPVVENVSRGAQAVNPLCQTQWNQAPNENGMCPYSAQYNERCVTGCVATAMAQIMKFWNYPAQGVGNHSYNDQNFGTQSANFGATTYDWAGMPNVLNSANNSVATLMFHCGVAVDMSYGVGATGGSSAYVVASESPVQACAEYGYKTYFGYDAGAMQGIVRQNYSDANWKSALKTDLDAGRPVQYAGFGNGGGHTWVCDGYDQNDMFHQNWGWGGNSDGYFSVDNLDPTSLGAGGGTGGFNNGQQALVGIKPANNGGGGGGGGGTINQGGIQLYAATTVSANPFETGGAFSVNADIANTGSSNFTGDFAAALFDNNGIYVTTIQEYTGQTANAGMHYQVSFSSAQLNLIPGIYIIGIYYKNGANNYSLINQSTFNNPVSITVTAPYSDVQMAGNSTITPATIVKNQAASIATQIGNAGSSNITGWLSADLYKPDGTWVVNVDEISGTLNASTAYNINFSSTGLNVEPGTYMIAYWVSADQTNWYLVYTTDFSTKPNPVFANIVDVPLSPDMYEANNSEGTAYAFTPSFSGNNASVLTSGSNVHVGNDYDYYNINLPSGTNYSITARVHDSYNSGNGNTYSNDVQFSYKVNGGNWSSTVDDVLNTPIYIQGGGTVTFFVADYFQGSVGTYLLDLQIVKGANVGISDLTSFDMQVFPNPASSELFINAGDQKGNFTFKIFNVLGEQIAEQKGSFSQQLIKTNVSAFAPGMYSIQLQTETGVSNSKFIVK